MFQKEIYPINADTPSSLSVQYKHLISTVSARIVSCEVSKVHVAKNQ
jgi:hypothetical protein